MDINDFKTFLEVNRTRHFGQAADNLYITQSTVSARIKALEDQLGVKLFVRERNNIQLTPEGEKMIQYAETITTTWIRATHEVGLSYLGQESMTIGGVPSLWDITLQNWMQSVYKQNTNLVFHAEILGSSTLHKRLLSNTLDIAFVYDIQLHDNLVATQIGSIPLIMVSTVEHTNINTALKDQYILVDWGASFLTEHANSFANNPMPIMSVGSGNIALNFLLTMGGSSYLAEPSVESYLTDKQLYKVEDAPVFWRKAYAVYNRHNKKSQIIQQILTGFSDMLLQQTG